jgi:NitT/TauT family transport system permease protein
VRRPGLARIAVRELTKTFRGDAREVPAVRDVSFTIQGARSVDADLIHSARFLGASETQVMRTVIVPSALAWTFASLTPSISFALIGVVVGEFLGGESGGGLGYLIIQSLGTLNAADMMVALLSLGIIGIAMALGIRQVEMRLLRWRPEYQKHT